jgi:putative ABC transport system substrate-binding protein
MAGGDARTAARANAAHWRSYVSRRGCSGLKGPHRNFIEGLQQLGWTVGRNVQIDIRWGAADPVRSRKYAAELAATAPDVIFATGSETTAALREATRTLPIVFMGVTDPVGAGYVASLARPSGNATGFTFVEYGMSGKWLELLKEIAPRVTRAAILRDPGLPAGTGQLGAIQALAPVLRPSSLLRRARHRLLRANVCFRR